MALLGFFGNPYVEEVPPEPQTPPTPFPGVAPVVTRRIHRDGRYDQGLDMGNGKGCAPDYQVLGVGAGGRLGVDPGFPREAAAEAPESVYDTQREAIRRGQTAARSKTPVKQRRLARGRY